MAQIMGIEEIQKLEQDKQQFIGKFIYWSGIITQLIDQDKIGIRMNPAISLKYKYDICLTLPQGVPNQPFQTMMNKQFNFVGQIQSLDDFIHVQMINAQIYNNSNVSQDVYKVLQNGQQMSVQQVKQNIQSGVDYIRLMQAANPNRIGQVLDTFQFTACVITCVVKQIFRQQKTLHVLTKPQGVSALGKYDYDVEAQLAPMVILPPAVKENVLVSLIGNYSGYRNQMVYFTVKQVQVHLNQSIDKLPQIKGRMTVNWATEVVQQTQYQEQLKQYLLRQLDNIQPMQQIKPPMIRVPSQRSVSTTNNQEIQSQRSQNTQQSVKTHQTQETTQTIQSAQAPQSQQAQSQQSQQLQQEQQVENVEEQQGYKPQTIVDSEGHVQIQEETNELQGQDCGDVARKLMQEAPQAAYVQPVKTILDYEQEDEALQIARKLNAEGKMKTISDDLMNNLDALNAFNLDNQQYQQQQQQQNEFGDYTQYANVLDQNGYGYNNNNDYGNYGNYGGYDIGGGSNNYGSYTNDYGSSNYNTTTDYSNYGNYGNYGW